MLLHTLKNSKAIEPVIIMISLCCLMAQIECCAMQLHDYFCEPFIPETALKIYVNRSINFHNYFYEPFFVDIHKLNPARMFEYSVYEILKKNPLNTDTHYFAFPWVESLFGGIARQVVWQSKYQLLDVAKIDHGFTVVGAGSIFNNPQGRNVIFSLLKKIGIDVIFTPAASKSLQENSPIKIIPFPFQVLNPVEPAQNKDIVCSFIGDPNAHPTRKVLEKLSHLDKFVIILRRRDFYNVSEEQQKIWRKEYNDVLSRSQFSLCPRGFGAGSFRFWESLQAGAIPIVISDDGLLPEGFDWSTCTIKIGEHEFIKNPLIALEKIKSIDQTTEQSMRNLCFQAYNMFSGDNLVRPIRQYYESHSEVAQAIH